MKRIPIFFLLLCVSLFMGASQSSCEGNRDFEKSSRAVSSIQAKDQEMTAKNFSRLYKAVPPPQLHDSQERKNLVKRLERFNTPNKISYIYSIDFGKVMAYYTIKGKVSSVNSMLTCTEQLVNDGGGEYQGRANTHVVSSPDLDGSYGSNGDGIFFFTTEDVYIEWNKTYLLCDQPLKLSTPPELVYQKNVQ
jgi:hypothetical protein